MTHYEKFQLEVASKLSFYKAHTDITKTFYEEHNRTKLLVTPEDILFYFSKIPSTAPTGDTYNILDNLGTSIPILEKKTITLYAEADDPDVFRDSSLEDIIAHDFGEGYEWVLTDATGEVIPFGLGQWVVNSKGKLLSFTGGFPTGYEKPLVFTFWRYCGPRGLGNVLYSNGSVPMDFGYTPTKDRDIVTKEYLDSTLEIIKDLLDLLTPDEPETFEGKDLEVVTPTYEAFYVRTEEKFKCINSGDSLIINVPPFTHTKKGIVDFVVNGVNLNHKISLENLEVGTVGPITVESITDAQEGQNSGKGIYYVVNMFITLDPQAFSSIANPFIEVYARYTYGSNSFFTNKLLLGIEYDRNLPSISNPVLKGITNPTYYSGIPAIGPDTTVLMTTEYSTMGLFRQDIIGSFSVIGEEHSVLPQISYTENYPTIAYSFAFQPTGKVNTETSLFTLKGFNAKGGLNIARNVVLPLRVDTLNPVRLTSGKGLYPTEGLALPYDEKALLFNNTELMCVGGVFKYPTGNFTTNSLFPPTSPNNGFWEQGPNYNTIAEGTTRYALFQIEVDEYVRGVSFELGNLTGVLINKDNFIYENIESIQIKVKGQTGWLNANSPYGGYGNPINDGDACMVVHKSDMHHKYATFGANSQKGTFFFRIGLKTRGVTFTNIVVHLDKSTN